VRRASGRRPRSWRSRPRRRDDASRRCVARIGTRAAVPGSRLSRGRTTAALRRRPRRTSTGASVCTDGRCCLQVHVTGTVRAPPCFQSDPSWRSAHGVLVAGGTSTWHRSRQRHLRSPATSLDLRTTRKSGRARSQGRPLPSGVPRAGRVLVHLPDELRGPWFGTLVRSCVPHRFETRANRNSPGSWR
jgi:hypothetical protein